MIKAEKVGKEMDVVIKGDKVDVIDELCRVVYCISKADPEGVECMLIAIALATAKGEAAAKMKGAADVSELIKDALDDLQ